MLKKINEFKSIITQLKKEQNENKLLLTKVQNDYNNLKNEILEYYHKILIEGVDTRKEGLHWVIQAIWDIGEEVNLNYIPNFLDIKAVHYLFYIAQKYYLLKKFNNSIE